MSDWGKIKSYMSSLKILARKISTIFYPLSILFFLFSMSLKLPWISQSGMTKLSLIVITLFAFGSGLLLRPIFDRLGRQNKLENPS